MLTYLSIRNFTIAEHVELEFDRGMTVITGETGAGKSISLDALALALGDRADSRSIRHDAERAEINATFDISHLPAARQWLNDHDLNQDGECVFRRIITREGRSRAYINSQPVTLQDLKTLGEMLIDIHSQHEHQSLLQRDTHRRLLDAYADATDLADQLAQVSGQRQLVAAQLLDMQQNSAEKNARIQLLSYQARELDALALGEHELNTLELEQQQLANADQIIQNSQQAAALLGSESGSALDCLQQAGKLIDAVTSDKQPEHSTGNSASNSANSNPVGNTTLSNATELIASALINCEEAYRELQHHLDQFEANPARLADIEMRLSDIYQIARKHRVKPEELLAIQQQISTELGQLQGGSEQFTELEKQLSELNQHYAQLAKTLSSKRQKASTKLAKAVTDQLQQLGMNNSQFTVALTKRADDSYSPHGNEGIEFLIITNTGQTSQSLRKIASGGELSRISLAIQVITAQTSVTPTLVFDEVDVGIGGSTAEVVGNLLRQLGARGQVICVTHQPQVAAKGHQHFRVSKYSKNNNTHTRVETLADSEKVAEIARMLGGLEITDTTLAHAREMLETPA